MISKYLLIYNLLMNKPREIVINQEYRIYEGEMIGSGLTAKVYKGIR